MTERLLRHIFWFSLLLLGCAAVCAFKPQETPVPAKQVNVHVLVPLCDNVHQGIVPVNQNLGNGTNLNTNLYWGAGYGIRSYFKLKAKWKVDTTYCPGGKILERVVFSKLMGNTRVHLIADAYRGDAMNDCLDDYFKSLSGAVKDSIRLRKNYIPLHGSADLMVFNGHNGLMDTTFALYKQKDQVQRHAAVIACASYPYFTEYFRQLNVEPLITTTGLMAPEAYVLEALITSWVKGAALPEIRQSCGKAYHGKHPKSSLNACIGLFHAGK